MSEGNREIFLLDLMKVITDQSIDTEARIRKSLDICRHYFDVDYGIVSHITNMLYTVRFMSSSCHDIQETDQMHLDDTLCQFVVRTRAVEAFRNTAETVVHRGSKSGLFQFKSYIGAPVFSGDQLIGTLCFEGFASKSSDFAEQDFLIVSMLAKWIGQQMQHDQEHEELKAILSSAPLHILHEAKNGQIIRANTSFAALYNDTPCNIEGKNLSDCMAEHHVATFTAPNDTLLETRSSMTGLTFELAKTSGETIWLHGSKVPYQDPVTYEDRFMSIAIDITDQRHKEQDLAALNRILSHQQQASQELYRRTPAMLHSIDRQGLIVDMSDHWLKKLEYRREEVIGQPIFNFLMPESRERARSQTVPNLWQTGYIEDVNYQFQSRSGAFIEVELSAVIDQPPGTSIQRALAVVVDVTERNKAMRALKEANEDLKQFNYMASHDIQEPLRKIRSFAEVLLEAIENGNDQEITYAIDVMRCSADRASRLVTDLLAFSRVSYREPALKECTLHRLLQPALDNLSLQIEEAQAELSLDLHDIPILADITLAPQAFQNLISNALKYRSEERPLHIRLHTTRQAQAIVLSIADNGQGFDQRYKSLAFEPFKRLRPTHDKSGTGIGLAIVQKILSRHGWVIDVDSEQNKGTCFTITIPLLES